MRKSIRKKFIIFILPFVLLVLISGTLFRMYNSKKIIQQEIYQKVLSEQDKRSSTIEKTISKIKGTADTFASGIKNTLGLLDPYAYNEILSETLANNSTILSYGVWFEPYAIDPNQKYLRAYVENKDGTISTNDYYNSDEFDYLNLDIYQRCKETEESFFAEAYYDKFSDMYSIIYVTPIHNAQGDYIGCVTASFGVNELNKYISESLAESINFYIVNNSGYYIADLDLDLLNSHANITDNDSEFKEIASTILDQESGLLNYTIDNEKYYVYFSTVSDFKWKFIYTVPDSLVNQHLHEIVILNAVLFVLTLVAILALIYYFSSRFVHSPFKLLLKEFDNISKNNFNSDITQQLVKTDTEFSEVGKALDEMKGCLTDYQNTLLDKNKQLKENEKALKETVTYVNAVISALPVMMFVFDRNGNCIDCHGSICFNGRTNSSYIGKNCYDFLGDINRDNKDLAKFLDIINTIDYSDGIVRIELPIFIDGKHEFFEHTLTLCRDNEVISLCRRTTDNVNYLEHMKYLSSYDELTGVFNSRNYNELLKNYKLGRNIPVSVIVLDVNGFKAINDSFGHRSGDKLLIKLAQVLTDIEIPNKIVARIAGDEFAVILPNTTKNVAENIFEELNFDCVEKKVYKISFSISFGVGEANAETDNLVSINKLAEELLYKQKIYTSSGQKDNTIELINSTLLAKNKREQLHSNRVSELCVEMAIALGWSKLDQNKIKTAGLLHDIGKIGISDSILNKPGKLNEEEYLELRNHPEIAYHILQSSPNTKELSEFAYSHHEKWDGTGYPRQLKGTEIIIEARIIAIVDAYDAITSSRSYREGQSKEAAIAELIQCKHTQFDPDLVDLFIEKVLHEKLEDYEI